MHSLILADWTTIRCAGGIVTQEEPSYLDLEPFQDVVFYVECRESSSSPTLTLQTAPTKDDSLFTQIGSSVTLSAGSTPTTVPVLLATASLPVARYVRWQINSGSSWDATFRILVVANSPGM